MMGGGGEWGGGSVWEAGPVGRVCWEQWPSRWVQVAAQAAGERIRLRAAVPAAGPRW